MLDWTGETGLAALFAAAFASATLLPANSEIVLAAVVRAYPERIAAAIVVATLGNTLGGMSSYALGRILPNPPPDLASRRGRLRARAQQWAGRYGSPALLAAWVPFIGDPLCVAAGWLRLHWLPVLAFMLVGKLLRYVVVVWLAL
jgi:membrane protein YqaA with SNARE-associated domain